MAQEARDIKLQSPVQYEHQSPSTFLDPGPTPEHGSAVLSTKGSAPSTDGGTPDAPCATGDDPSVPTLTDDDLYCWAPGADLLDYHTLRGTQEKTIAKLRQLQLETNADFNTIPDDPELAGAVLEIILEPVREGNGTVPLRPECRDRKYLNALCKKSEDLRWAVYEAAHSEYFSYIRGRNVFYESWLKTRTPRPSAP
ncbi:hypothetical protein OH77DRAFT_1426421 [Trametes cingulata]|nr:hypothetical protein OH77DRAFT_1426421 [Trametes cingulata]